jgi:uncharacterized protein Yka (UPF0111/DUF47 family)
VALVRRDVDEGLLDLYVQAGGNAERAAGLLLELLSDVPERAYLAGTLKQCEHDGDRLTHDIIHRLRRDGARPPVDLGDGHALATALDDIVDHAEQTADWLVLYAVEAPMEPATQMAGVLARACARVKSALSALRAGTDPAGDLRAISLLEDECDRLYREGVASLFVSGIDPMVVIRWKDIFAGVEAAVDACETVGHVVEGITLKRRV